MLPADTCKDTASLMPLSSTSSSAYAPDAHPPASTMPGPCLLAQHASCLYSSKTSFSLKYKHHARNINATQPYKCHCKCTLCRYTHTASAHAPSNPNLIHTLERILPPHALPQHAMQLQKEQGKALGCLKEMVCPAGNSASWFFLCQAVFQWPPSKPRGEDPSPSGAADFACFLSQPGR